MSRTIRKRGNGTYWQDRTTGRWCWQCQETGRDGIPRRKKITAKSLEVLTQRVTTYRQQKSQGLPTDELTVEQWAKVFLQSGKSTWKGKTYRNYLGALKNHIVPAFRTRKLATLRPYEIQQWFQELLERPLSISTVLTIRRIFEVVLSEAVRNGLIDKNPVCLARPPKYKKKPIRIMSLEQMQELLRLAKIKADEGSNNIGTDYLQKMYYVFIYLGAMTGCRAGELAALTWPDFQDGKLKIHNNLTVDHDGRQIIADPKSETSRRTLALDPDTSHLLTKWRQYQQGYRRTVGTYYADERQLIFANAAGGFVSVTNLIRRYWHPLLHEAGLPTMGLHSLRKFHASYLAKAGIALPEIAARLGHADCTVLNRYYLTTVSDQRDIINALAHFDSEPEPKTPKNPPDAATSNGLYRDQNSPQPRPHCTTIPPSSAKGAK
ncbi:site-specific integrase [Megasphaera sp.]|uniref:tyrosine-type recombinase/integrase n=1 Tax=Megasphaera sp. TaxID=2023260 RepID=UPI0025BA2F3E|nr:site-specific integrase [Megasphaera sp.]MCF0154091.1 site-specific integrase [Megasphaera sp.]